MKKERILSAVSVMNYAVDNNISVKEASVKCGFADTYIKNIKALVYEKFDNDTLDDELFTLFNAAYRRYLMHYKAGSSKVDDIETSKKIDKIGNRAMNAVSGVCTQTQFGNYPLMTAISHEPNQVYAYDSGKKDFVASPMQGNIEYSASGNEATVEWKSDSSYPADHIKTLEQLLIAADVDQKIWHVKDYTVNKWDVTSWKRDTPQTIQNFQVKARLERDCSIVKEQILGEIFKDMVSNYEPPVLNCLQPAELIKNENNLFELALNDLHLGKLCWNKETGENYDIKIASERFLNTIVTLINRVKGFEYSRILFPVGNDFFNSDTIFNTTTKGTLQDEDVRWQKTFQIGTRLLVDAINMLKQTGRRVDVVVIPGNHDFERSYYMGEFLVAWFNDDHMVNINNGASPRKYYRFGEVLLGFTHGSEEKENSLPMLMASDIESKPMWSETTYHEFHVGHIHRKRDVKIIALDNKRMTNEDLGVTVRYLSSLSGTDSWHFSKGFTGSIKAGEAFIWNDKTGLIAHLNANLIIE